jgi:hypothetical protein
MKTAQELVAAARAREKARTAETKPPDWEALNRIITRQRAALTRAKHTGSADAVVLAVAAAVRKWNEIGVWPDDWSSWQRAVDDALGARSVEIGDLA